MKKMHFCHGLKHSRNRDRNEAWFLKIDLWGGFSHSTRGKSMKEGIGSKVIGLGQSVSIQPGTEDQDLNPDFTG